MLKRVDCCCVIPFYNEGSRLLSCLEELSYLREMCEFILVDDGSEDGGGELLLEKFADLQVLRFEKNRGKAEAVFRGLEKVKQKWVLLFDADVRDFSGVELREIVEEVVKQERYRMVILRQAEIPWFYKVLRLDLVRGGLRLVRAEDLREIGRNEVKGYQLELAMNRYYQDKLEQVAWRYFRFGNYFKVEKWKGIEMVRKVWKGNRQFLQPEYWRQALEFRVEEVSTLSKPVFGD